MKKLKSIIRFFFRLILALLFIFFALGSLVALIKLRGNVSFQILLLEYFFNFDSYVRISLPTKYYPLGAFISYIYCKLAYIFYNIILLSSFETATYDITTSYCFNLLLVYQDTNLFIILILGLVYYCLYKIIEEHLYNLYGDNVSVYPYLYGRFRRYSIKFYDFGCSLLEELEKFQVREIALNFKKFFPVSLFYLFDTFNIYKSNSKTFKFKNFNKFEKFMHIYGLWYLKFFIAICLGSFKGGECFSYARIKKVLNRGLDFKFINFFDDKIFKNLSSHQYDQIQSDLISGGNVPFFKQKMYYVGKINQTHVLYQLFLMSDNKNIYSYDSLNTSTGYFKIFDDSFLYTNVYNLKSLRNLSIYGYIKNLDILYNNLQIAISESNQAKNAIDFDVTLDNTPERYKSHKINSYIYLYNRSGKYLSLGVPLNNNFSSDRFIEAMSIDVKNTFSFYDVFSIFLNNIFVKKEEVTNLGDSSTYVMLSEPYIISILVKLGSYNHCQHSLDNGPWYDVVLKAHELVHSFAFEYAWAIFPSSIICYLMVPAYLLLYSLEFFGQAFLMIKIMAHQWFWSYEIENSVSNSSSIKFDSNLVTNEDYNKSMEASPDLALPQTGYYRSSEMMNPKTPTDSDLLTEAKDHTNILDLIYKSSENFIKGSIFKLREIKDISKIYDSFKQVGLKDTFSLPRLLSTDTRLILPAEKPILLSISSSDVLHAFAVPNFGLKVDAVPGRINTFWLYMNKAGIYYGQCSELCGKGHGFMPIVVDSQHYSNNPFQNEILPRFGIIDSILSLAKAEEVGSISDSADKTGNIDDSGDNKKDGVENKTGNIDDSGDNKKNSKEDVSKWKNTFQGTQGIDDIGYDSHDGEYVSREDRFHRYEDHTDFFADKGFGRYFGDGPIYLQGESCEEATWGYDLKKNDLILKKIEEIEKIYGKERLAKPYGLVRIDPERIYIKAPFKELRAAEILKYKLYEKAWECQRDPNDKWSTGDCEGVVYWEKIWGMKKELKISNFFYFRGAHLIEPQVFGNPPLPIAPVARNNYSMGYFIKVYLEDYAASLINWTRPNHWSYEKHTRIINESDNFGILMAKCLQALQLSLASDPSCLNANEAYKATVQNLEQFIEGCKNLDIAYEKCQSYTDLARFLHTLAKDCLYKTEIEIKEGKADLTSATHKFQKQELDNGNLHKFLNEVDTLITRRQMLFDHVKYQEQTYFRDYEALKESSTLMFYL